MPHQDGQFLTSKGANPIPLSWHPWRPALAPSSLPALPAHPLQWALEASTSPTPARRLPRPRTGGAREMEIPTHAQPIPRNGPVPGTPQAVAGVPAPVARVPLPDPPARSGRSLPRARRHALVRLRDAALHVDHSRRIQRGIHRDPLAHRQQARDAAGGGQPREQDHRRRPPGLPRQAPRSHPSARRRSSRSISSCRASRP